MSLIYSPSFDFVKNPHRRLSAVELRDGSGNVVSDPIAFVTEALTKAEKYPSFSVKQHGNTVGGVDFLVYGILPLGHYWYWPSDTASASEFNPTNLRYANLRDATAASLKRHAGENE